jgi:predicted transposase/invertase (TIGR01784 family)
MKIQNVHDKFFKETFGRTDVASDFLINYLPKDLVSLIDFKTIEPQKDSFINKKLKENFSDLLFKTKINDKESYIYFLLEHKSHPDKKIAFQLLTYIAAIWNSKHKINNTIFSPIIIPMVFYHGNTGWNIKSSLGEMLYGYKDLPPSVKKYVPDYEYLLYDLSNYSDDDIKGHVINQSIMLLLRDIQKKNLNDLTNTFIRVAIFLKDLENKQKGIEYFEIFLRYILGARPDITKEDYNKVMSKVETTYPEGSEITMTLIEVFREEGRAEGIEKGIEKGMIEVARKAIREGMNLSLIEKLTGLPRQEIEKIAAKINEQ